MGYYHAENEIEFFPLLFSKPQSFLFQLDVQEGMHTDVSHWGGLVKYPIFILFPGFSSLVNAYTGSQINDRRTQHLSRTSAHISQFPKDDTT